MTQLLLIPEKVVDGTFMNIPLTLFPEHFPGRVVDSQMVESIAKFGVLQPILCKFTPSGDGYLICDGRSRIINSRASNRATVPAYVFPYEYSTEQILTIVANTKRSENFVTDVLAIQDILDGDKEVTLQQICNATGLSQGTAKKRMKLLNLIPDLFNLLKSNHLSQGLADRIAGLNEMQQKALYNVYLEHGRITAADVKAITSAGASQATLELDDDLFDDEESLAIQLCRDILAACRLNQARIPAHLHGRLMELVGEVDTSGGGGGDFEDDDVDR